MVYKAPFRFDYKAMLLRLERRVSSGLRLLGSYAYSRSAGTNTGNGFDLDNWLANTGPTATDLRHLANAAGVLTLPQRWELAFNVSYASAPPFSAFVGQIDFNGDGMMGDLLPGTTVNVFNRGMNRADLARLVGEFNTRFAGTRDARGALIPALDLPARYWFGDSFQTLDVRLTRSLDLSARARIDLILEVFNACNAANLCRLQRRSDECGIRPADQPRHAGLRLRRAAVVSSRDESQLLRHGLRDSQRFPRKPR